MKKGMTQEEMMEQGLSDKKIGSGYGMDNNAVQKFKRENGLIKPRAEAPAPEPVVEKAEAPAPVVEEQEAPPLEVVPEHVSSIKERILQTVESQIDAQTDKGIGKYSHDLDDCPPEKFNWQQMINEELIDALQYQQKEIGRLQDNAGLTLDTYQELSARTAVSDDLALLNYGLGISGEAGEVADLIKKQYFHGHRGDEQDLAKELGDVLWYVSQIARHAGVSLSEIAQGNIDKLQKRYPEGFSEHASVNRSE